MTLTQALRPIAALLLACHGVGATASTFEGVPALELTSPAGAVVRTMKIFPDDSGIEPAEWIVSTSDGHRAWFALEKLPPMRVSGGSLWIEDRRVVRLQSARCHFPSEHALDDATSCTTVAVKAVIVEPSHHNSVSRSAACEFRSPCPGTESARCKSRHLSHVCNDDIRDTESDTAPPRDDENVAGADQPDGSGNGVLEDSMPTLRPLKASSDIGKALSKYLANGETVLIAPRPPIDLNGHG